jgi:probable F420-dependent oxidoreductase
MKFQLALPGLNRYPPDRFPPDGSNWEEHLSCADFQLIARAAEDAGFDALSVSEHLALPAELAGNMGAYWPHAFTAMAFIAGATTRIRVNSGVIVLPYHHPVALAKAVSTLDVLSSGRVSLTFGVGMASAEFAALGARFEQRGKMTDEYIDVMKVLWTEESPEFHGSFVSFEGVIFDPKPVQQPHPPIWFGGRSMVAMRRAAIKGTGWAPAGGLLGKGPWFEEKEQLPGLIEQIGELRSERGLDPAFDIELPLVEPRIGPLHTVLPPTEVFTSTQEIVDGIGRLAELGVTWTTFSRPGSPPESLSEYLESLQWAAEEVLPLCRSDDAGGA